RLSMLEPPKGVSVQKRLEGRGDAWNAGCGMYQPVPLVSKQVLEKVYKDCGWDPKRDVRGRPITLDDLRLAAERWVETSGYEPVVKMNIEAAMRTRIASQ